MANDLLKGVAKGAAALFTLAVGGKIAHESQKNFQNVKIYKPSQTKTK